jgi:hypothetical protein
MTEDFNTFEQYAKCVYEYLKIVSHDYQMAANDNVRVVYATAPVAYAKEQEHFANGSNVGPLITFYQSGIEIDHNVQMGAWKYLPVRRKEGNYLLRAPVICQINYTVTINALTELQADMLQAQIMQSSPFHRPYYTKLNGQFVLIESSEPANLSSVEIGDNSDKISRREIKLTIDRAYLNYDIKELNAGIIKFDADSKYENKEGVYEKQILDNGAILMSDGSIKNGEVIKNTSNGADGFFNYNIVNDKGEVVNVIKKGKLKLSMYSFEGVRKN